MQFLKINKSVKKHIFMLNIFCKSYKISEPMLKQLKLVSDSRIKNLSLNDFEFIQSNNDGQLGVGTFAIV